MTDVLIQLLCPFFGALGFALMFRVPKKHLLPVALGGLLSGAVSVLTKNYVGVFAQTLLSAAAATVYCEVSARRCKAPATVFIPAALMPLLPGRHLYIAISAFIVGDRAAFVDSTVIALQIGFAISVGLMLASIVFRLLFAVGRRS